MRAFPLLKTTMASSAGLGQLQSQPWGAPFDIAILAGPGNGVSPFPKAGGELPAGRHRCFPSPLKDKPWLH